jgi:hypothetical protein
VNSIVESIFANITAQDVVDLLLGLNQTNANLVSINENDVVSAIGAFFNSTPSDILLSGLSASITQVSLSFDDEAIHINDLVISLYGVEVFAGTVTNYKQYLLNLTLYIQ